MAGTFFNGCGLSLGLISKWAGLDRTLLAIAGPTLRYNQAKQEGWMSLNGVKLQIVCHFIIRVKRRSTPQEFLRLSIRSCFFRKTFLLKY